MAPPGRPAGGKAKEESKSNNMEKYVTGGEEIKLIKEMRKVGKEIEENIGKRMEKMIEQFDQIREEWKEEKRSREEERKKDKEEWREEKKNLERRLENLEWEREKKEREKRKNNIVIRGANKWEESKIEKETKEFIKNNLKIEVNINKAFKVQVRGGKCTVVAEVGSWEQKREIMIRKKELQAGIFIDDDLTRTEREMQTKLREKAKEEREKGNKVKVGYGKIMIGDRWYRWSAREKKLIEEKRRGEE
jgi:hypothetical protein